MEEIWRRGKQASAGSVPGRRHSQSKGSEVGRYLACSIAGRPVCLEGREQGREWEGPAQRSLVGCSEALASGEETEVLRD